MKEFRRADLVAFRDKTVRMLDRQARQIEVLQDILAPLLEEPAKDELNWDVCRFCEAYPLRDHKPDCPVLRRDELLGRAPVAQDLDSV